MKLVLSLALGFFIVYIVCWGVLKLLQWLVNPDLFKFIDDHPLGK